MEPGGDDIRHILSTYRTWAFVGASPDRRRPAHFVAEFMQQRGYRIIPVNPLHAGQTILGETCYRSLEEVPLQVGIEVVDLFRRSEFVADHVDEAIAIGAEAVWMQVGVVDEDAAARARHAGIRVVMDKCPNVEIPLLLGNSFRLSHAVA